MPQRRVFKFPENWVKMTPEEKSAYLEEAAKLIESDQPQAPAAPTQ